MTEKKLPRRERVKLQQRQEMLAAALTLFSEKGYHNVSMHEIAQKAEFAIGTLYKHFQNKEDLYKALVLDQCGSFHDTFVAGLEKSDDEIEQLRSYVRTKIEHFKQNLPFIRLYLAEIRGASFNIAAGLDEEVRQGYYDILARLAAIFESGIRKKRFKDIAASEHLAVALESTINGVHLLWLDAPELIPYPDDPDALLDIFFRGLLDP